MNNRILAFLAGVFLFAGCASLTADKIDRNALLNLYYVETLDYHFKVSCYKVDCPANSWLLAQLDTDYNNFEWCMQTQYNTKITPDMGLEFRYIIVPKQFECPYHSWCGGEYHIHDPENYIILAMDTPNGRLAYDAHEWRDVCVQLGKCPKEVKEDVPNKCTKFLMPQRRGK
jgi:hypothetical protein